MKANAGKEAKWGHLALHGIRRYAANRTLSRILERCLEPPVGSGTGSVPFGDPKHGRISGRSVHTILSSTVKLSAKVMRTQIKELEEH